MKQMAMNTIWNLQLSHTNCVYCILGELGAEPKVSIKARFNDDPGVILIHLSWPGGTMAQLAGMRKQLQNELAQKGFIPREAHPCSLNAQDPGIVRAVLAAGMYPMVGTLLTPLSGSTKVIVETGRGEKVRIHPHSISIRFDQFSHLDEATLNQLLVVFDEVTRGESQVRFHNISPW